MQYIVLIEKSIYRSSRVQGNAVRFLVDFNGVTRCGLVEARQCQDGSEGGPSLSSARSNSLSAVDIIAWY